MDHCKSTDKTETAACICHFKNTQRSEEIRRQLQNRLNRIIGQLNGIKKMLDDNRYCGDILIQTAAVEKAMQHFGQILLKDHMETCVVEEIRKGNIQVVEEAIDLINKLK